MVVLRLIAIFFCRPGKDKNNDVDHHGDVETSTPSLERDEAEPGDCFSVTGDQGGCHLSVMSVICG